MVPTVRQLECFLAVARHLHFGAAAASCHISQPALSAQIQGLERLLEVQLFERDRRQVRLTPAGRRLLHHAKEIMVRLQTMREAARDDGDPLSGDLRLGVIPTVAPYVLPHLLPRIRKSHPRLRLLIREEETARLIRKLELGELDLLLLALEADLGRAHPHPLFRDRFVAALPWNHPLSKRKLLREGDLLSQEVLLLDDGH